MKNTFGSALTLTLFGESHGPQIGCVLDGLAPGMNVSEESVSRALSLRRPKNALSTARSEADAFSIVSGVKDGKSTGTPLCITIPNQSQRSADYPSDPVLRPGHADLTAQMKYHGFQDVRGGGHFSGRITAPLVAAGAIVQDALREKGIFIGTHIKRIADVSDGEFNCFEEDIRRLSQMDFPLLNEEKKEEMERAVLKAKEEGNSVGGVLETVVCGMPSGVGEPWFDSVESVLSHALFSVPAIKGVEFGDGFALAGMKGSEANDAFYLSEEGTVYTKTNHNGGINGGITNGMPLLFCCAVKPTPTIFTEQDTVSLSELKEVRVSFGGRHDPCIVHRAAIVVTSVTALALADLLTVRFGTDYLGPEKTK